MSVIDHLDLATRHIYLAAGVREYHPVADIYREVRALRRTVESLRKFDMPILASGNVAKGGGKFTPRYATFRAGWKVVPEDVSHVLYVTGEQITDEGESGPAAIDFSPLSPTSKVIVQYEAPAAEVILVGVGNGAGDTVKIAGSAAAATQLSRSASLMVFGTVDATVFTPTRTEFDSTLQLPIPNLLKGRALYWNSGALRYAGATIAGYSLVDGRGHFEVSSLPAAPSHGDAFLVV